MKIFLIPQSDAVILPNMNNFSSSQFLLNNTLHNTQQNFSETVHLSNSNCNIYCNNNNNNYDSNSTVISPKKFYGSTEECKH